eukprot:scaffold9015_cov96-Isochrysis_galbana.AAC.6
MARLAAMADSSSATLAATAAGTPHPAAAGSSPSAGGGGRSIASETQAQCFSPDPWVPARLAMASAAASRRASVLGASATPGASWPSAGGGGSYVPPAASRSAPLVTASQTAESIPNPKGASPA